MARLLSEAPWLGFAGTAALIDGLKKTEYERVRNRLLSRWWETLARARAGGRLSRDGRERSIASSYVLLKSKLSPEEIMPATVRNVLGDELAELLYGTTKGKMSRNYTGEQIEVLRGLEAVRKRPGMYIGNTAERGLHQLVYEAVDNAVDEALAGYAHNVRVVLHNDGSCSVEDDGRGIPIDVHAEEKLPAVEVVMTMLHAGGKFGKGGYKVSGGLHGVGISVVNALSEWMITQVKRDGWLWEMKFERGLTVQKLKKIGKAEGTGTMQWFKPDTKMFEVDRVPLGHLAEAPARAGVSQPRSLDHAARRARRRRCASGSYKFEGGIVSFVEWLNEKKDPLHPIISTHAERDGVDVEVAMQYTGTYTDQIFSYANNINTIEGGMHLQGFRQAVTNDDQRLRAQARHAQGVG